MADRAEATNVRSLCWLVRRRLWALIVTLSMSRYTFVWPTFTQTPESLCEGLDAAWHFFGGTAQRVVLDSLAPDLVQLLEVSRPARITAVELMKFVDGVVEIPVQKLLRVGDAILQSLLKSLENRKCWL